MVAGMSELNGAVGERPDSEPPLLLAELWYSRVPDLNDPRLLSALRAVSMEAEAQDQSITIPHSSITLELEDGIMPLITALLAASPLDGVTKTLPDTSQTWDWVGVDTALAACNGSVLVSELLARLFPPQQRVAGFLSVLQVIIEATRPLAISWPHSQRITDPDRFDPDGLDGVINVRFFAISNDPGAQVMDTLGLHIFELPDLQCHYRDFDPAGVAAMLYSTAIYVFDKGDVIDDGHTISGPRGDERFVCRHERSLMKPLRPVIDVDLGGPYAAGRRERG
jgi:hypothetical protein